MDYRHHFFHILAVQFGNKRIRVNDILSQDSQTNINYMDRWIVGFVAIVPPPFLPAIQRLPATIVVMVFVSLPTFNSSNPKIGGLKD